MSTGHTYKILISGGGTGGHIFPAVAIADALKASGREVDILFAGAAGRMEMEKVPAAGYRIVGLPVAGIQRRLFALSNFLLPFKVLASLWQAFRLVRNFKPDIVIGTGGYASGPVLYMASWMGIPTLIQEQNAYAGVTNKILGRRASRICVAYEGMDKYFCKDKIRVTGNPARANISAGNVFAADARAFFNLDSSKRTVLVIGGSLGARTINRSIQKHYKDLLQAGYQLVWQTGKAYYKEVREAIPEKENSGLAILEFIANMDKAYAAADVIISRAGANSISELCIAGKPVVLVPSPNVAEDHQTKNAMALVEKEAALLVKDAEAEDKLVQTVLSLSADEVLCHNMSANIKRLAKPAATAEIVSEIWSLVDQKYKK